MMDEHIQVGNKYPSVKLNTTYSFGLDDQDFVVAFESDEPKDFVDLVMELRETQCKSLYASRYSGIHLCPHADRSGSRPALLTFGRGLVHVSRARNRSGRKAVCLAPARGARSHRAGSADFHQLTEGRPPPGSTSRPEQRPSFFRVFDNTPKIALPTKLLDAPTGVLKLMTLGTNALPDSMTCSAAEPADPRLLALFRGRHHRPH